MCECGPHHIELPAMSGPGVAHEEREEKGGGLRSPSMVKGNKGPPPVLPASVSRYGVLP